MSKPIKKIILILILIILLPILFLTIREISTLNENEQVIEEIYQNQLESLLFSVNQYSEDIVRSWMVNINSLNYYESFPGNNSKFNLSKFFNEHPSVKYIFIADSLNKGNKLIDQSSTINKSPKVDLFFSLNKNIIDKLYRYRSSNYIKIEPLESIEFPGNQLMLFILENGMFCAIVVDPEKFIQNNLSSKIQSIARKEFSISVYDSLKSRYIYSSQGEQNTIELSKSLWLIPSYYLGISLQGVTISDLVKEKTNTNLIFISALTILMFIIALYGYRNIRREVELAQIKSDFVSNVSHELRTPLSLISMFAETLSMGRIKNEEKRNEYYTIIQQETERLSKIVNKILNFSKIEAGKWKYNFNETDLNLLTEKIYSTYKFHLEQNGFTFRFEPSVEKLITLLDPESVSEAIINLIDNAIKYSSENKFVTIRTGFENKKVFIEVEDRGIGISPEDQKKIFDKFFRITSGNIHNTKGTGLGLTLVNHIMDAHKGEINLKSELGKGSVFRLAFPLTKN